MVLTIVLISVHLACRIFEIQGIKQKGEFIPPIDQHSKSSYSGAHNCVVELACMGCDKKVQCCRYYSFCIRELLFSSSRLFMQNYAHNSHSPNWPPFQTKPAVQHHYTKLQEQVDSQLPLLTGDSIHLCLQPSTNVYQARGGGSRWSIIHFCHARSGSSWTGSWWC